MLAVQMAHEIFGFAGSHYSNLIDSYAYDFVTAGACVLFFIRGFTAPRERAWLLLGLATLSWLCGDILTDFGVGGSGSPYRVSAADALWLMWYPLAVAGIVLLVRSRLSGFDLARWIDGIALALVAATPGVALVLQPAVEESHLGAFAHAVLLAYPAGDLLLLGAALGVIGLAGWRPGRMWLLLAIGVSTWVFADALYSVQTTDNTFKAGVYDYLWPAGMLLMAAAAWQPRDIVKVEDPVGWKAVALPITCQLVALGTQIWGLVTKLGESERLMTIAVLAIVVAQLYVSRPRHGRSGADSLDGAIGSSVLAGGADPLATRHDESREQLGTLG